ncbi:8920_t:CDS:2, partial [Ambispora gerdemannii]
MSEIKKNHCSKKIEKKDVFSTSNNNDSKKSNKAKEIEFFEDNSLAKNKRKQPTESEENPQQQIDWTLVSTTILATDIYLNSNENNSNLSITTYSDQME